MKKYLVTVCAVIAAGAIATLSAYGARHARAADIGSARAVVSHPSAKGEATHLAVAPALSAGVQELAGDEGLAPSSLKELAVAHGDRPATVFGTSKGTSTCAYLTGGTGAVGGCMQLGANMIAPRIGIVDGGTYVWGLAANSVDRVQARTGGQTFAGSITGGIFTIEISNGSNGTGPIDLLVTSGSSTTTITLPGVPKPIPAP
ncbi:MAG TPA: hypothetical protein VF094_12390 [Gaiellaceae bacterium]